MITENLSTLKIHKLTQAQYARELEAGNIDENALYLTPDEEIDLSAYITEDEISSTYETKTDASSKLTSAKTYTDQQIATINETITSKAEEGHTHTISDVTNLQSSLDSKVDSTRKINGKALSTDITLTASDVNADASGTAESKVNTHNTSTSAHSDIRSLIAALSTKVNNFLDVDDTTTDQLSEVLELINNNKGTLESLTTSKINVSDIVDNLTTSMTSKVLSANQGVVIKGLIDALEAELDSHTHAIADVTGLQSALDGKAATSHGTHVTYSTTAPVMDGTASAGTASTVARSDHKHPTDTSRAAQTDLDSHTGNTTVHITSTERTNWGTAYTHSQAAHAPSNAEKNQNAFSNVVVGTTTIAADSATDTLTLVAGDNVTITPDATNDKVTITAVDTVYTHPTSGVTAGTYKSVTVDAQGHVTAGTNPTTLAGYGITDAAAKDHTHTVDSALSSTSTNPVQNKVVNSAIATATSAISANTSSIDAHTTRITALEDKVGDGFESITTEEIQNLFS